MIFADASALIAIMAGEQEADEFSDLLAEHPIRLCSALSAWETAAGLCRSFGMTPTPARAHVTRFMKAAEFSFVPIGEPEWELAAAAYATYGKGRHRAGLNMGDCFAYACAKSRSARLLYKGNDFDLTDLAWPRTKDGGRKP